MPLACNGHAEHPPSLHTTTLLNRMVEPTTCAGLRLPNCERVTCRPGLEKLNICRLLPREETFQPDCEGFCNLRFCLLNHLCSFAFSFLCQTSLYQVEIVLTLSSDCSIRYNILTIVFFYFSKFKIVVKDT